MPATVHGPVVLAPDSDLINRPRDVGNGVAGSEGRSDEQTSLDFDRLGLYAG